MVLMKRSSIIRCRMSTFELCCYIQFTMDYNIFIKVFYCKVFGIYNIDTKY